MDSVLRRKALAPALQYSFFLFLEYLSFTQVICSYILRPMVFMMGVEWTDCPMVAEMVGIKFFTNEFVAYQQLSQYKNKRLSGVEEWIGGEKQWISVSDHLEKHNSLWAVRECHTQVCFTPTDLLPVSPA